MTTGSPSAGGPDGGSVPGAEPADLPQPVTVMTTWSVRLPAEPGSARGARRLVREALAATGRLEHLDAAELASTELVTNVILHAHTDMELLINVDHVVRVE